MQILFSPVRARSSALDLESNASWEPQIRRKGNMERKSKTTLYFVVICFIAIVSLSCFALMHSASIRDSSPLVLEGVVSAVLNSKGLVEKPKLKGDEALANAALSDRKVRMSQPQLKKKPKSTPNKAASRASSVPATSSQSLNNGLRLPPLEQHASAPSPNVSFPNSAAASSCRHNYGMLLSFSLSCSLMFDVAFKNLFFCPQAPRCTTGEAGRIIYIQTMIELFPSNK